MMVCSGMSYVALQKQRRYWCERTIQDGNDTVGEGTITGLILVIGIISIVSSIAMVVGSVVQVVHKQQILMELFKTLIVAGLLLAIGLGSLHFFRKRLRALARKKSPWEL